MNTIRTTLLLALLTGLLVVVGGMIGGLGGAVVFLVIAAAMNFFAFWFSDRLALKMAGAREVTEAEEPRLAAMVHEVANLANMPMPRLYVIDTMTPNAFATGRSPKKAAVAVTAGIRQLLNDRELRAVIGHEMGHVKNRDTLTSSIVATIAGAISLIGNVIMFRTIFGGNQNQNPILMLVAILIAPIAAGMIQMGISRTREFAADKTGAEITHDPEALASALMKLEQGVAMRPMPEGKGNDAISALYIVHPFAGGGMRKLFSTHPPVHERVKRLRQMAGLER